MALDRSIVVLFGNDQITLTHVGDYVKEHGGVAFHGNASPFKMQDDHLGLAERLNAVAAGKSAKVRAAGLKELNQLIQTAPTFKAIFFGPDVPELRTIRALVGEHGLGLEMFSGTVVPQMGLFRNVPQWSSVSL